MFENIIGHKSIITQLQIEIKRGRLPSSLLFTGEPYSGRLTTALELARVLSCGGDGSWRCPCSSCARHRLLESSNTVLLTTRNFSQEIRVCADTLKRTGSLASRYLYIRAVRKLMHTFNDILWKTQDQKIKKVIPALEEINEQLEVLSVKNDLPPSKKLDKILSTIEKRSVSIEKSVKNDSIPVQHIRNTTFWAHTTSNEKVKIVIIDGVDKLGAASGNALLKILEEPPPSVFYILIGARKEGIIPTILSRVRTYPFSLRNDAQNLQVIKKIFKEDEGFSGTIERYFLYKNNVNEGLLRHYASQVLVEVTKQQGFDISQLETIIDHVVNEDLFVPFLHEITDLLRKILHREQENFAEVSVHRLVSWYNLLNEALKNSEFYNQNTSLLLLSLCISMREC